MGKGEGNAGICNSVHTKNKVKKYILGIFLLGTIKDRRVALVFSAGKQTS